MIPEWMLIWCAIIGGFLGILGQKKWAVFLAMPLVWHWLITPLLGILWHEAARQVPLPLLLITGIILAVPVAIKMLHDLIEPFFGKEAAGHVTGNLLMRCIDGLGRGIVAVIVLPVRLLTLIFHKTFR
jgi:hypothetical protein